VLGAVPATDGPKLVRDYRKGRLDLRYVRGRSALGPAGQAARHHARVAGGEDRLDAYVPSRCAKGPAGGGGWS
jgi:hypothetical protein